MLMKIGGEGVGCAELKTGGSHCVSGLERRGRWKDNCSPSFCCIRTSAVADPFSPRLTEYGREGEKKALLPHLERETGGAGNG